MENGQSNSFKEQLQELFFFYDRAGIGVIDKPALLSYFSSIDKLINQNWLHKILLPRAVTLKQSINFEEFLKIMEALSQVPDHEQTPERYCEKTKK